MMLLYFLTGIAKTEEPGYFLVHCASPPPFPFEERDHGGGNLAPRHPQRGGEHRCRFCDYSAHTRTQVTHHERSHTGERPFVCPVCSKGFTQLGNLRTHLRTVHEGQRNHRCDTCGHTFQLKHHLQKHQRIHLRSGVQ